jgi:dihydroxyacetone kinase
MAPVPGRQDGGHSRQIAGNWTTSVAITGRRGHELAGAGYGGASMLSAAVVADVFTSTSSDVVMSAIQAAAGPPARCSSSRTTREID